MTQPRIVLFVSKRNSMRSVLARACLEHVGKGRFKGLSCGQPQLVSEAPHPAALMAIASAGIALRADSPFDWTHFARNGSPRADFVITMDESLEHLLPSWPGQPDTALWAYPDILNNGSTTDADILRAGGLMLHSLRRRLEIFASLPMALADRAAVRHDIRDLGYLS